MIRSIFSDLTFSSAASPSMTVKSVWPVGWRAAWKIWSSARLSSAMSILAIVFSFFHGARNSRKLTQFFYTVKFSFYFVGLPTRRCTLTLPPNEVNRKQNEHALCHFELAQRGVIDDGSDHSFAVDEREDLHVSIARSARR